MPTLEPETEKKPDLVYLPPVPPLLTDLPPPKSTLGLLESIPPLAQSLCSPEASALSFLCPDSAGTLRSFFGNGISGISANNNPENPNVKWSSRIGPRYARLQTDGLIDKTGAPSLSVLGRFALPNSGVIEAGGGIGTADAATGVKAGFKLPHPIGSLYGGAQYGYGGNPSAHLGNKFLLPWGSTLDPKLSIGAAGPALDMLLSHSWGKNLFQVGGHWDQAESNLSAKVALQLGMLGSLTAGGTLSTDPKKSGLNAGYQKALGPGTLDVKAGLNAEGASVTGNYGFHF